MWIISNQSQWVEVWFQLLTSKAFVIVVMLLSQGRSQQRRGIVLRYIRNKEFTKSIPMILDLQAAPDTSEPTDNFKLKDGEFYPHRTSDVNHFKNSYFSLVTESNFLSDDVDERNDYNGECMFITEKTYRALCFHPTIIAGNHSTLKYLQSLGFETFHGFFNEEYDDEPDDHKRMLMVVNEVERICNIPKKTSS